MNSFSIDKKLRQDCYLLGELQNSSLLLLNNSLYPWFIIVPHTGCTEFHQLESRQQLTLLDDINLVSRLVENHFDVSKLNTACIGNIVRQLHIHIIGRHENDPCWPGVVWGTDKSQAYTADQVKDIRAHTAVFCGDRFKV